MRLFVSDNTTSFISNGWKKSVLQIISVAKHYLSRIDFIPSRVHARKQLFTKPSDTRKTGNRASVETARNFDSDLRAARAATARCTESVLIVLTEKEKKKKKEKKV